MRFPEVATEVVRLQPDVIVVYSTRMALAVKAATTTLPVVAFVADPVGQGLVPSLAQHKGNITGIVADGGPELGGKRLQLLKEAAPRISRVAILISARAVNSPIGSILRQVASELGLATTFKMTEGPYHERAYAEVFASLGRNGVEAVLVGDLPEHVAQSLLIAELAAKHKVPAIFPYDTGGLVAKKGLMVYGVDQDAARRHFAGFVDRILQGSNPAEMPFEQISNYRLTINLKTAKALGLTIPPSLLLRADQVVE
jgi:putative tryptophan/tyrosine transport system substrate-binding protein